MITLAVLTLLYFLPAIIASNRGRGGVGIFTLNVFFGWTGIGWLALLLWAVVARSPWYYRASPVSPARYDHPYYGHPQYGWRRY